jgi:hypothetical protein
MYREQDDLSDLVKRFRSQGGTVQDAVNEWHRQARENLRETESVLLETARRLDANDDGPRARHLRELAEQIKDHREAGHYTTQG